MNLTQQLLVFNESLPQMTDCITRHIYKIKYVRVIFLDALCEVSKRNVSFVVSAQLSALNIHSAADGQNFRKGLF